MQRIAIGLILAGTLTTFCLLVLIPWESSFLENQINVSPLAGTRQQQWLTDFQDVAVSQVLTAIGFTVFWIAFGLWYYRIRDWKTAGGRLVWSLLLIALVVTVAMIGWYYTPPTQSDSGKIVAVSAYVVNALLIFYLPSLLSSPTSVKYAPIGAVTVGRGIKFW